MDLLNSAERLAFRQAINNASDTFNQHIITWYKLTKKLDFHGDDRVSPTFLEIPLNCYVHTNYPRVWPSNIETVTGEIDKESIIVILNRDYLFDLGYINDLGAFGYDPEYDYFKVFDKTYKVVGDKPIGQGLDLPSLFYLILVPKPTKSGNSVHSNIP